MSSSVHFGFGIEKFVARLLLAVAQGSFEKAGVAARPRWHPCPRAPPASESFPRSRRPCGRVAAPVPDAGHWRRPVFAPNRRRATAAAPSTSDCASLYRVKSVLVVIQVTPPSQPLTFGGANKSCPSWRIMPQLTSGGGSSHSSMRTLPISHCTGLFTWLRTMSSRKIPRSGTSRAGTA